MSIRKRAILVIVLTNFLIIIFSVTAGIFYVKKNIEKSQETDLMVIADIADHFISSEINILKLKAAEAVHELSISAETEWPKILANRERSQAQFIGMAVFDGSKKRIAASGERPAPPEIMDEKFINRALAGNTAFSSTYPSADGVVFYLAAPLNDNILIVTLPGMHFSELLSTFVIWETGHIFIDDSDGNVIANIRESWVQNRQNFMIMAKTDKQYEGIASVIERIISGETGVGYFTLAGVPRLCAFRPVTASEEGWCLGIVAPLPESPFRDIDKGLLVVGLVGFFLSGIVAVFFSTYIRRPFEEIAALKEAAESNSKYKSKFLATMSHEIRTPMNVILGVTESQLLAGTHPKETRGEFEKIYDAGHLLLNIINDILDLSKIEAGKFELNPVNYEALSLINDVSHMYVVQFGHKQIKFILQADETIPLHLFGDEIRIKQILNNLLSNAYKYSSAGQVVLSFAASNTGENKTTLVISVSDTGQGMTAEQVKKLFEEYARFNLEANRTTVGTGLGMAITHNLIKMMDGTISVESSPGQGSTFTVRIPQGISQGGLIDREAVENLQQFNFISMAREKHTKIVRQPMPYGKVLIVDDMKSNLDVAKLLLNPYQLNIDTAESGFEAIGIIRSGREYDIVFMDHMMPEMDGIEAVKKIRDLGYRHPIIALTASAVTGQRELFLTNGFDGFISKPVDIRQLNDTLNKFIRDRERGQ